MAEQPVPGSSAAATRSSVAEYFEDERHKLGNPQDAKLIQRNIPRETLEPDPFLRP